jgi:predicted aminopeptidase
MARAFLRLVILAALLPVLQGCIGISYYAQSLNGHLEIVSARQPVDRLIADPAQPEPLRMRLALASDIRRFATDRLALPDNDSYRSYVDTRRDYVTWAVFAAPEFALGARTWCFPVYGCVPYKGYFSEKAADKFAAQQQRQGLDVHVSGIPAYSTLGRLSDPLLNTMFRYDETYLAGVIFHELAHQRVYVAGDTGFNEAFATAVEVTGVEKWLTARSDRAALRRYRAERKRKADFLALLAGARDDLRAIYASGGGEAQKRAAKAAAIDRLRARYRRLRDGRWGGYRGYDKWFESPINNAKLAATGFYNDLVPAFERLFEICSGDYERFYAAVRRIGKLDRPKRAGALRAAKICG